MALDADKAVRTGKGKPVMARLKGFDVPPPGRGVNTVTCAVPMAAMSDARIDADSCWPEVTMVGRLLPFHRSTEEPRKFCPVACNVKEGPPNTAEAGVRDSREGTGFSCVEKDSLATKASGSGGGEGP